MTSPTRINAGLIVNQAVEIFRHLSFSILSSAIATLYAVKEYRTKVRVTHLFSEDFSLRISSFFSAARSFCFRSSCRQSASSWGREFGRAAAHVRGKGDEITRADPPPPTLGKSVNKAILARVSLPPPFGIISGGNKYD
jgi:hypothetical protein